MKCTQRMFLTADRDELVPDGDERAATLYAVPGDEIPQSAADKFGLVDGHLPDFDLDADTAAREKAAADAAEAERVEQEAKAQREKEAEELATAEAKAKAEAEEKERRDAADKERKGGSNKEQKPDGDKQPALTDIKGIGPATAKAFDAAGITTVEQLAAIDVANPPELKGLPAVFKLDAVVSAAKELVVASGEAN